ncbi:SWIM zinc finger family protein [Flavobacterium alkalisoli]
MHRAECSCPLFQIYGYNF